MKGEPLILVHGWPDSPRTWDKVLPTLHQAGYQTIVPYLRGYGPSSFRDPLLGRKPRRTGQPVAFAQDMIHLADRLDIKRFHFIGHDWGARTGYALAALFPKRLKSLTAVSVPFEPGKASPPSSRRLKRSGTSGFFAPSRARRSSAKTPLRLDRHSGTFGVQLDGTSRVTLMNPLKVGKAKILKMLFFTVIGHVGDTPI
nr:alpha/beta fold hydrolase [Terriglobus roseus]